jgi:hypothetical protein
MDNVLSPFKRRSPGSIVLAVIVGCRGSNSDQPSGGDTMDDKRHTNGKEASYLMKRELNVDQRLALAGLEQFGWELKFVRRPPFQKPIPVVFDPDRKKFAVLEPDGRLNEKPGFEIRH